MMRLLHHNITFSMGVIHLRKPGNATEWFHFHCSVWLKKKKQVSGAGTKHRSQVIVLPIQKVSQPLVKANLRPKNFCLGLIRPKVSFYKWLGYFLYW